MRSCLVLMLSLAVEVMGCGEGAAVDEVTAGDEQAVLDGAKSGNETGEWLGLISIAPPHVKDAREDFGVRVANGSLVTGVACREPFYAGRCNVWILADSPSARVKRVRFMGRTGAAVARRFRPGGTRGDGWTIVERDITTPELEATTEFGVEWRRVSDALASGDVKRADIDALRSDVRVERQ